MKYIGENAIKKLISLIKGDLATKQPTITASGLLKGDGAGTVTAADTQEATLVDVPNGLLKGDGTTISAAVAGTDYVVPSTALNELPGHLGNTSIHVTASDKESWNQKVNLVITEIPKGRMRGDVDGDGKLTLNDVDQINKHFYSAITLTGADFWCADINGDNKVDGTDSVQLQRYLHNKTPNQLTSKPTFADYYNNWTYHKVDAASGYWTTDIIINELSNSALKYKLLMAINGHFAEGMFYKIERSTKSITTNGQAETKTVLTIYSKYPPIEDTKCFIYYSEDSNASADIYTIIVDTLVTEAEIEAKLPTAIPDATITSTWNSVTI